MLQRVPFAVGSNKREPMTIERLVNCFVEKAPAHAKAQTALINTPGQVAFCDLADLRGLHKMRNILYAVAGETLYSVDSTGTATSIDTIPGSGLVDMATNGTQLVIVVEPSAYVYEDELNEITDPDFPGASSVTYQDGYFIFTRPDTGQFFISALLDGTDYDALDFATAEGAPDDTIRVISDHRELWLFGEETIEIWYNSGAADFPFERVSSAFIERGCLAPRSVAKFDNSLVWLGNDGIVYRGNGYTPLRISDHGIEETIRGMTSPENAVAWSYAMDGHTFYVLTFPNQKTIVYDASTGEWHDRKTYDKEDWLPQVHCYCYGKHLVGSTKIYELSADAYDDDGTELVTEIYTVTYGDNTDPIIMRQFQLDIEAGVGLEAGTEPTAMLRFSDDGKTWSNELTRTFGAVGEYSNRVIWRRLGLFRQRALHISISDPVKRRILGGFIDYGG